MNRSNQIKALIITLLCFYYSQNNAQQIGNRPDTTIIDSLFKVGYSLELTSPDSAIEIYKTTAKYAETSNDKLRLGKSNNYMGIVYSDMGDYESALDKNRTAIKLFEDIGYDFGIAATKINTGNIYLYLGETKKAIELYYEGTKIYEELKDTARLLITYINISTLLYNNNFLDESLNYNYSALQLARQMNDYTVLADIYTNLANIMDLQDKDELYKKNIDSAVFFANSSGYIYGKILAYNSLGNFYSRHEKHDSSKMYFKLALKNTEVYGNPYNMAETYNLVGLAYLYENVLDSADFYLTQSYRIAREKGYQQIKALSTLNLSEVYFREGNYREAYQTLKEHLETFSELKAKEKQQTLQELDKKYQVAKKEQQIQQQTMMLELNSREIKRKNTLLMAGIIFSILAIIIVVLLLVLMKKRKIISNSEMERMKTEKEKQVIKALLDGEDKERKRIARELHDGVNGNLAVLKLNLSSLQNSEYDKLLDQTMDDVRGISHNLMPDVVRKFGLKEALENYISSIKKNIDLDIHFQYFSNGNKIEDELAVNIYRIVQELVKNGIEHAEANEILVQITANNEMLQLTIEDNGKGFTTNNFDKPEAGEQGIGLANVKNRVSYHFGSIEISSSTHAGTSFNIEIPLNQNTTHD